MTTVKDLCEYLARNAFTDMEVLIGGKPLDLTGIRHTTGRKLELSDSFKTEEEIETENESAYNNGHDAGYENGREDGIEEGRRRAERDAKNKESAQ